MIGYCNIFCTLDGSKEVRPNPNRPDDRRSHTKRKVTKKRIEQVSKPVALHGKGLNRVEVMPLFRNSHAVAVQGLRMLDYVWMCQLDEAKGFKLHKDYRTKKSAATFVHHIAQAEREKVGVA